MRSAFDPSRSTPTTSRTSSSGRYARKYPRILAKLAAPHSAATTCIVVGTRAMRDFPGGTSGGISSESIGSSALNALMATSHHLGRSQAR